MKNRTFILVLFFMLLVVPTSTVLACGKSSDKEKPTCHKEDNKSENNSCCHKQETGDEGCHGACDNAGCHCSASVNAPVFLNDLQIKLNNNYIFLNNAWSYVQHFPKAVFLPIWQPPKIS